MTQRAPILHILTSDEIIARPNFLATARALIQTIGRQGAFHLRTRKISSSLYIDIATDLAHLSHSTGTLLVINDRLDIALTSTADGIQLGRGALSPQDVHRIAPTLKIGASIHTPSEARTLNNEPSKPTWLLLGHLFNSKSHPESPGQGLPLLHTVTAQTHIPIIAVGGIRPDHIKPLITAGATGIAVISGIWDHQEPSAAATHYLSMYGDSTLRGDNPHD